MLRLCNKPQSLATATYYFLHGVNAVTGNGESNGHDCVPIQLYYYKKVVASKFVREVP